MSTYRARTLPAPSDRTRAAFVLDVAAVEGRLTVAEYRALCALAGVLPLTTPARGVLGAGVRFGIDWTVREVSR